MEASKIFQQSDGSVTRSYYAELEKRGVPGQVAVALFRAQKTSSRAKQYRGKFKGMAYDTKQWSMGQLSEILLVHGEALGIVWGWKTDPNARWNEWVLYVELRGIGQVSFHSPSRGKGPDFRGDWDGKHESQPRILEFCDQVFHSVVWFCACGWSGYSKEMKVNSSGGTVCPRCGGSGGLETKRIVNPKQNTFGF